MLVSEVKIENIKGFDAVSLDFRRPDGSLPHWIVVAGRNGSGKTTFLQSLALAICGPSAARTLRETYANWIRVGAGSGHVSARLHPTDADRLENAGTATTSLVTDIGWRAAGSGPEPRIITGSRGSGDRVAELGPWSPNPQGWFIAGYGAFRRISAANAEGQRLMTAPGRPAGLVSLFHEGASLSEALTWLQQLYLRRLEGAPDAQRTENLVLDLLNDGLLPEGMHVLRITSEGLWVRTLDGTQLRLHALSDGHRTVTALVLDLLRQLVLAYGELRLIDGANGIRIAHEGVVLIDEMDMHLHVSWQKRIGFWLKKHFPHLQFIVTTHSPFICQAADKGGLVRLPGAGEDDNARIIEGEPFDRVINGTLDDVVLTDLFGLDTIYSERTVALRDEVARLETRAGRSQITDAERDRLLAIRSQLPRTMSSDIASALRQLDLGPDDAEG